MILHMMFIIVVQQWVFSYDYIMILHMMIAMFIAHKKMFWDMFDNYDDDYQEFWAPNIKNCISKRPNEHLKCRCWWDLRWTAGLGLRPHWTHEVSGNPVLESIEQLNIFLGDNFWRNTWWFQLKNILWDKRPYSMSSNTQCQTVEPAKKKKVRFYQAKKRKQVNSVGNVC